MPRGFFTGKVLNLSINLRKIDILTCLEYYDGLSLHLFRATLIYLRNVLPYGVYKSYTVFLSVSFFFYFYAIVNVMF